MKQEIKERIEQINNGIVPEGYRSTGIGVLPEDWNVKKLKDVAEEITERAGTNKYETLSISAGIGFVNQAKKFGKELSGKQYGKYTVLKKGDFSYNKGNSKKYPQGCIYMLKDRECAAVPNVFESFRFNSDYSGYYEQLFILGFHNKQLYAKINHGVRDDGLLNLNGKDFYSIKLPQPPLKEQKKIAEILSAQDKVIELKEKLIEQKKLFRKHLSEKLLGHIKDDWNNKKCPFSFEKGSQKNKSSLCSKGIYPVYNGGTTPSGYTYEYNCSDSIIISEGGNSCGFVNYIDGKFWASGHCFFITDSELEMDFLYHLLKYR